MLNYIIQIRKANMIYKILTATVIIFTSLTAIAESGRCYKVYDPFEKFNRGVFKFNHAVDRSVFRPAVKVYKYVVPKSGQQRVNSFFYNIKEPLSFVNYILQGKPAEANKTFWRFFVNTFFGIGGLFDFASKFDLNVRQQTFSNTMMNCDMNYGAYIMVPILGPFTTRDLYGQVVDTFIDPSRMFFVDELDGTTLEYSTAVAAQTRIKSDELLDDIESSSIDTYTKTRSLYLQSRAGQNPTCEKEEETISYDENF